MMTARTVLWHPTTFRVLRPFAAEQVLAMFGSFEFSLGCLGCREAALAGSRISVVNVRFIDPSSRESFLYS